MAKGTSRHTSSSTPGRCTPRCSARGALVGPCIGLTGPWCYYRGLRDRLDILQVLWEEGLRFTRADGRNEHDRHPVAIDVQPYLENL